MPKGPKVSIEERQRWIAAYESGTPVIQIAQAGHRDVRTIAKNLELARTERDRQMVRQAGLHDASRQHQEDLVRTAESLMKLGRDGGALGTLDRRTNRLIEALRSHDPSALIWRAFRDLDQAREHVVLATEVLVSRARTAVHEMQQAPGVNVIEDVLTNSVVDFVNGWPQDGRSAVHHRLAAFSKDRQGDGVRPTWYTRTLTPELVSIEETALIESLVTSLAEQAAQWPESRDLTRARAERRAALVMLEEGTDTLILRHIVPGRCDLCPV